MTRRLTETITRLYRPPPDGRRQVFALSRPEAERLPRLSWVAIISITAPGRLPAYLDGFEHVLRVSFADLDFLNPALSPRARAALGNAFTVDQAMAIRQFVESLPCQVTSIVVHCEGGYSRSSAIALALHRLYGYEVAVARLTEANPSVLRVMLGEGRPRWKANRSRI